MLMNRSKRGPSHLLIALGEEDGLRKAPLGTALLIAAVAAALGFRLFLALGTSFPINDGALFFEFVRGIADTFPGLPASVRYNGIGIPFAYPPLSFWLGAGLTRVGSDPMDVVHLAPIAMNGAYVLLFAALLLRAGHGRLFAALALLFTFTALRSFEWLVMGGGLSRGLGSLFLLVTLLAAGLPPRWTERTAGHPGWPRLALGGLAIGGAILSHLEWGILAAASFVAARALAATRLDRFVRETLIAAAGALLLVLPWLAFVIATHGLAPFLSAGGSSSWNLLNSSVSILAVLLQNAPNLFFLLGLAVLIARRDWFWPLFIMIALLLTPRHSQTPIVLAVGAISAHGVFAFLRLLRRIVPGGSRAAWVTAALVAVVIAWQVDRDRAEAALSRPLSPARLEAMAWVRTHHPGRDFAIVTGPFWAYDASAEWFPTLTRARSITTVQGREWLPDQAYTRWSGLSIASKRAASCADLRQSLEAFGRADFLWVETRFGCFRRPGDRPVFGNGEVVIIEVAPPR